MSFLDRDALASIDAAAFQAQKPYPWVNPANLLTDEGFEALRESLPGLDLFSPSFGKKRRHGQQSHDYWTLEYDRGVHAKLAPAWRAFMEELQGEPYRDFVRRLFGTNALAWRYHWHYHPTGCSVSPHCDSRRKLGSHIFYFNTPEDWDPSWGGETLILDDHGRFSPRSAPDFDDFPTHVPSQALGNYSLLFRRNGNSWHGVREIDCPEDRYRKVLIVVVNRAGVSQRLRDVVGGWPRASHERPLGA